MNLILFERREAEYILSAGDSRLEHVRGVLRAKVGDVFDIGVVNGPLGKGRVVGMEPLTLAASWLERPQLPVPVHLLVGMSRPATMRKVLQTVSTLGVRALYFPVCQRTDPAYARASLWRPEQLRADLQIGAEQAFDTYLPEVRHGLSLAETLALLPTTRRRIGLDLYEARGRMQVGDSGDAEEAVCVAIGPERGWGRGDREVLRANGFELRQLPGRVMRVETAVVAALALVLAAR